MTMSEAGTLWVCSRAGRRRAGGLLFKQTESNSQVLAGYVHWTVILLVTLPLYGFSLINPCSDYFFLEMSLAFPILETQSRPPFWSTYNLQTAKTRGWRWNPLGKCWPNMHKTLDSIFSLESKVKSHSKWTGTSTLLGLGLHTLPTFYGRRPITAEPTPEEQLPWGSWPPLGYLFYVGFRFASWWCLLYKRNSTRKKTLIYYKILTILALW